MLVDQDGVRRLLNNKTNLFNKTRTVYRIECNALGLDIDIGDIIEIPTFIFNNLSKIFVRMRLNSSYLLLWGDTVYAPSPTPVINFTIEDNRMIIESVDKIDYTWDFDISLEN